MKTELKTKTVKRSPGAKSTKAISRGGPRSNGKHKPNGKHPFGPYEHVPVGIVEASLDGKYMDVNDEFCRILGYSRKELLRRGIKDCTHEDDYGLDHRLYEQLIAGKIPFYKLEKRFVRKDGGTVWVELTRSLVADARGKPLYTAGVVLDISDRKDVESVLRDSVERLRLATASAQMFMWEWDFQTQSYTIADNFEQVLGFSAGLLPRNKLETVWSLSPREDVQQVWESFTKAIENKRDLHALPFRVINPENGESVWLEISAKVVYDGLGAPERMFGVAQNITERKNARDEIAIISRMPEENPNPVMRFTPEGDVLYANGPSRALLEGWKQQTGQTIPDELKDCVEESFRLSAKQEIEIEYDARTYSFTLAPIREAGYVNLYGTDITERKQAEEWERRSAASLRAAAEANAKFRTFFEQGSYFAGVMAVDGTILEANRLSLEFAGFKREDVIGRKFWECGWWTPSPALVNTVEEGTRQAAKGKPFRTETAYYLADGTRRYVDLIIAPVKDESGNILFLAPSGTDITERKQMEDAIRESEERFRAMVSQATAGISECDLEGRMIFVNPAFCKMLGYAEDELLGKTIWELTYTADLEENLRLFQRMLTAGEPYQFEKRFIRKDGAALWTSVSVTPVHDLANRPKGGLGVVLDIDNRKQAEVALAQYARQQEALYKLSEQLHRTESMAEVYEAALDAIVDALQCDRASILLLDEARVMRFVAWRGLSDAYRKATEGHSPWSPDERDPRPVSMDDVRTAELSPSLREVIREEGIGSLAFIPLLSNGQLIGKFMAYFDAPHRFEAVELDLALTIARQLASGIDRKRAGEALTRERETLERLFETMPVMVSMYDPETNSLRVNAEFERLLGWKNEELSLNSLFEGLYPDPEYRQSVLQRLAEAGRNEWVEVRARTRDGRIMDSMWSNISIAEDQKLSIGMAIGIDITERKQTEKRLALLAEISEMLRNFDDPAELMYMISEVVGKHLNVKRALFNEIDLDRDLEIVHRDYHQGLDSVAGLHNISDYSSITSAEVEAGKTVVNTDSKTDPRTAHDYERTYAVSGERAYVAVPLMRDNRWVASFWVSDDAPRRWTPEEVSLLETVAERTWAIIEKLRINTTLRESEQRFREMIDALPAAIYTTDAAGVLTHFNPAAVEFSGRTPRLGVDQWCVTWKLFHPDGTPMPHEECPMALTLKEGQPVRGVEAIAERPDGRRIWFEPYPTPLRDREGSIVGGINMLVDITERKRAEQALRESEQRFREIFETAGVSVWVEDFSEVKRAIDELRARGVEDLRTYAQENPDFLHRAVSMVRILDVNNETLELFEAANKEELLKSLHTIFTPHAEQIFIEEMLAIAEGREMVRAETQVRTLTGRLLSVLFTIHFAALPGDQSRVVVTLTDITERKQAETALRIRARQQQAVARLGELALRERDLQKVFDRATAAVAETLEVEYCKVLELLDGGGSLLLRSGVGWQEGLVGSATVGTGIDSQAGFTLQSEAPVVVDDLREEQRFHGPPLLFDHGVISGMSCIIRSSGGLSWGVLGTHSTRRIDFTEDDVNFLVAVANILGDAIQREQVEEALRASEERYRFIVENTSDGIWWVELTEPMPVSLSEEEQLNWYYKHAVMRQCNLGLARMYGYDSIEEVVGLPVRVLMPRELPENLQLTRQFIRAGYRLVDAESREVGADGRELIFLNNMVGIVENDRLIGEWGTNRDITERKQAEEALRRNEQMFSTLVNAAPFGVYFIDSEFRLQSINQGAEGVFRGIDPLIGRDFAEILRLIWKEPFATEAIERFRHTLRTGESYLSPPIIEERANIEEIQAYDWQIHRIVMSDGTFGVVCYFYDLSEQKQMEATVRASEALYRTIARSIPGGGVYVVDKDFRYLVAEGPVTEAFGLSRDMLEGRTVMDVFPDERGTRMEERLRRNFAGERVDFETQFNKRYFWTQMAPVHDSIGQAIILTLDITERKQAEEALRASELQYRNLFELVPVAVYSCDAEGLIQEFNHRAAELWGRTPRQNDPQERYCGSYRIFYPDGRFMPHTACPMARALKGETLQPHELEIVVEREDGRRRNVMAHPLILRDEQGEITGAINCLYDITERKQIEEALRQSEERFALFMQHLPALAWLKDLDGRYVYANAAAEKAFNRTSDVLYGRTDEEIFPPEVAAQFRANDEQALSDEKGIQVIETLEHADGVLHSSLVSKFPIPGPAGRPTLIGGTAFDITERLRAQEALRESEERFRAILRQATAGIVRKDAEGRLIFVNEAFCNMLGRTEAELLGMTMWDFMHEDDIATNRRSYERLMLEGIPFRLERRLIRADGSVIWLDASVSPIMDAAGKPQSAVAVEVDITGRKQAEEALLQLNLQLEDRVLSRTAKLRTVNQTLREEIAERQRVEEALRQSEGLARANEEKLLTLFQLLPVGISFLGPQGQVIQVNPALEHIMKLSKEQLVEQMHRSRKYIRANGTLMPPSELASQRALTEGKTVYNVETGVILEDGEIVWTSVSAAPVNVADVGAVVVTVDITESKRAGQALQESRERLQVLSQRLVEVQEEERRAIARELHDRVGQTLAALNINLIIINSQLSPDTAVQVGPRLSDSMKLVAETITLVRDVMSNLRPSVLDDYGLEAAIDSHLAQYTSRYEIAVQFEKPGQPIPRLGPSVEMTFLRIAQEALMNIARHAQATRAHLALWQEGDAICMKVQDNGTGITSWKSANRPGSHGLTIMRERAEAFGGTLQVNSVPGEGTTVEVKIPVDTGDAPASPTKESP